MTKLYLDTETYSECDLKKTGGWVYSRHPTTECLLLTWAIDDGPVRCWDSTDPFASPDELNEMLLIDDCEIIAHNSQFDRWIIQNVLGIDTDITRWRCTMAKAYTMGLPGSLGQLAASLQLDDDSQKIADGKRLIRKFCMPQAKNRKTHRHTAESDPEDWQSFIDYAVRDTHTLREIDRAIPNWNYRGFEVDLWHLDQKINDRGLPVDTKLAYTLAQICDAEVERLDAELADLTGGAATKNTQIARVTEWLNAQGVHATSFRKADVTELLARDDIPQDARRVIEIRQQAGRSSTSKYVAFGRCTDPSDHRIRGGFQYGGAMRTLRWAGRLVQPQNFPRPTLDGDVAAEAVLAGEAAWLYDDLMEVGASCLRSVIKAPKGRKLVAGDYTGIENRVLPWLAGEEWKLQAFRDFDNGIGYGMYELAYARSFNVPVESIGKESHERQVGKVLELSLGFQGAVGALRAMGEGYGMELPADDEEIVQWVKAWRAAHPRTVALWYALEEAAKQALRTPGQAFSAGRLTFKKVGKWLLMRLPSGRFLCYYGARLVKGGKSIQYQGLEQGKWCWLDIYGGKFAENGDQAVSRDVMAARMPHVEEAGYPIIGTVHDEVVTEVDEDFGSPDGLIEVMAVNPSWAEGLPLAASAWEGKRYRK